MGVFSRFAPDYVEHGLAVFPVDPCMKRPLVRGWQNAGLGATRKWIEKFPDAEGIGLNCGPRSGITEVDVDIVGEAAVAEAMESFGETPIVIRTASHKYKLWYGYNGEGRCIRPPGLQGIDILGGGYTIGPPSWRSDLGQGYDFLLGSLDDLDRLPAMNPAALERSARYAAGTASGVLPGERNTWLWRACMIAARDCSSLDALVNYARALAAEMAEPLGAKEVERIARSAWDYQVRGMNYLGLSRPQVSHDDWIMDTLMDAPDAYFLLALLRRWHGSRAFALAPRAMSQARRPPWHYSRIEKARDALLEAGLLMCEEQPQRGRRAGRYRLTMQMPESVKDHIHRCPPAPRGRGAEKREIHSKHSSTRSSCPRIVTGTKTRGSHDAR